ncbi:MAG: hypothetical protein U0797_11750 [Gemmataceae bacterium]
MKRGTPEEKEAPARWEDRPGKDAHVISIEDELRQKLGMKVEVRLKAKDKGQFVLSFDSNDDFERVVERCGRSRGRGGKVSHPTDWPSARCPTGGAV